MELHPKEPRPSESIGHLVGHTDPTVTAKQGKRSVGETPDIIKIFRRDEVAKNFGLLNYQPVSLIPGCDEAYVLVCSELQAAYDADAVPRQPADP